MYLTKDSSTVHKDLPKINKKKADNAIEKWDRLWTNEHIERCSTSVDVQEMQIKITMGYHYAAPTLAKITKGISSIEDIALSETSQSQKTKTA